MKSETKSILLKDVIIPIIAAVAGAAIGAIISSQLSSDSLTVNIDGESITVHSSQYKELVDENAALDADILSLTAKNDKLKEDNSELNETVAELKHDVEQHKDMLDNRDIVETKKAQLMESGLKQELTESTVLLYNGCPFFPLSTLCDIYPGTVSFDTKDLSIILGEIVPEKGYLLDVCPPYQTDERYSSPTYMTMCGENYLHGIQMNWDVGYSYFNLNGNYSTLEFDLGHIDGGAMVDGILQIYLDGQFVEEYNLSCNSLVRHYTLNLKKAHQMQFSWESNVNHSIIDFGMANITVA